MSTSLRAPKPMANYAFILTKSSLLQSYVPLLMSEFVPAKYLKIFLLSIFRTWPFYCMKTLHRGYSQIL